MRRFITAFAAAAALSAQPLSAQDIAIVGGTIYPVSGPKIENGVVVIRDGRITAVGGMNTVVPPGIQTISGTGMWITPGFINSATTLGLSEGGSPQFSGGYNDTGARGVHGITASFEAWRGINPASTLFGPSRDEGVTSVVVMPGGGMVSGKAALIDLVEASTASAMLRRGPLAMVGDFGNPGSGDADSRGEYFADWRALMDDVKAYQSRRAQYETGATRDFVTGRAELEALIPVAAGQMPLLLQVDKASDILEALAFAKEYNLKIWLAGASEAWMVAKEIAAASVPVFVGAMNNIPTDFNSLNSTQENAALLRAAGATVVLIGNGPGDNNSFNVRNIRQEAGNAVAYGMSWDDALRAITLTPAEVMGVSDRLGSIAVGRDANIAMWAGDPFEFANYPVHVIVRGRAIDTPTRQDMLTFRYLRLPTAAPEIPPE